MLPTDAGHGDGSLATALTRGAWVGRWRARAPTAGSGRGAAVAPTQLLQAVSAQHRRCAGRSQQDSLIRYTKDDFYACANSNNTRIWTEWQNCQEENLSGTLEGLYPLPAYVPDFKMMLNYD